MRTEARQRSEELGDFSFLFFLLERVTEPLDWANAYSPHGLVQK